MAVDLASLRQYVGASEGEADVLLQGCLEEAVALVDQYAGGAAVPLVILDRAYTEVAADLFNRRNAPNGVINQQFALEGGGQAVRIARDPMAAAYKLLQRWVGAW